MGNSTTVDAFVPKVWSKEIVYQTTNASIFADKVRRNYDGEIKEQGDKVYIPLFTPATIEDKPVNNIDYKETKKEITISQHKYFAFRVEDIANIQAQPDLIAGYAAQGGRGLANTIDKGIFDLCTEKTINQSVGNLVGLGNAKRYTDIRDNVLRVAIERLNAVGASTIDRFLIVPPSQHKALLDNCNFISADKVYDGDIIRHNFLGKIYGVLVYFSPNIPQCHGDDPYKACVMFQKEALALCMQTEPMVQAAYDLDYLATSVVGDILYGFDILKPEFIVQLRVTPYI